MDMTKDPEIIEHDIVEFDEVGHRQEQGQPREETMQEMATASKFGSSVIDFLRRPLQVGSLKWDTGKAAGVSLGTYAVPTRWLASTMVREKLGGFRYFRSTCTIKVQVNAQPMNAGMLIIWFNPLQNSMSLPTSHESHFGGITGYRHVCLNVNRDTSAELVIPFSSNLTHYDLLSGFGELGVVNVMVYSPLTGNQSVDLTVWMIMSDIEIEVPTGLGIIGSDQMNNEQRRAGARQGIISATARAVAGAAGALSYIPALSSFVKPVGWAADAVGGVAEMFGFSKPQNASDTTTVVQRIAHDMTNFNGTSQAKMLALDSRNSVEAPPSMDGSGEDQMALAHLLRKWIYMDRFRFGVTNSQGAIIWEWPVSPIACRKTIRQVDKTMARDNHETMLSYLSRTFTCWRGSIDYNFKIIATPFHTGRLELSFVPGALESTPIGSIDFAKIQKKIIDLRETSEFTFSVPFVHNEMWVPLRTTYPAKAEASMISDSFPTGMLYLRVINSLRNPATVADEIEVIVETRAGFDFEFAQPNYDSLARIAYGNLPFKDIVLRMNSKVAEPYGSAAIQAYDALTVVPHEDQHLVQIMTVQPRVDVEKSEEVKVLEWKFDEPIPVFGPIDIFWLADKKTFEEMYSLWNTRANEEPTEERREIFSKHFKIVGETQSNDQVNTFIRDTGYAGPKFDALGMGERITSLRQVLKRYVRLGFDLPYQTTPNQGVAIVANHTNWSVYGKGDVSLLLWPGLLDWYTGLYRWRSGSMRYGFMFNGSTSRSAYNTPVEIKLFYPTASQDFDTGSGLFATAMGETYDCKPKVSSFQDKEGFLEVNVPQYSHLPAIPTDVGRIPNIDYLDGPITGKMAHDRGAVVAVRAENTIRVYRSIGEDFNLDYSLGPPITYVQYNTDTTQLMSHVDAVQHHITWEKNRVRAADEVNTYAVRVAENKRLISLNAITPAIKFTDV